MICHGSQCKTPKPDKILQQEIKTFGKTNVRDYCPRCKSHNNFTRVSSNNAWSCNNCHAKCRKKGKPIPEP